MRYNLVIYTILVHTRITRQTITILSQQKARHCNFLNTFLFYIIFANDLHVIVVTDLRKKWFWNKHPLETCTRCRLKSHLFITCLSFASGSEVVAKIVIGRWSLAVWRQIFTIADFLSCLPCQERYNVMNVSCIYSAILSYCVFSPMLYLEWQTCQQSSLLHGQSWKTTGV